MPLQSQTVDVPFEGGLDTNLDRKKVIPGKLLDLENATFDGKSINMRPGGSVLFTTTTDGGSLPDAKALAVRGPELLCWTSAGVYGRATASSVGAWQQRVGLPEAAPLTYRTTPLASRAQSCECYDSVSAGGVVVTCWTEKGQTGRELRATVQDEVTGTRYQDAVLLYTDTNGSNSDTWRIQTRMLLAAGIPILVYAASGPTATVSSAPVYALALLPGQPRAFQDPRFLGFAVQRTARTNPYEIDAVSVPGGFAIYRSTDDGLAVTACAIRSSDSYIVIGDTSVAVPASGGNTSYLSGALAANNDGSRLYITFTNPNTGRLELHSFATDMHPMAHISGDYLGSVGALSTRVTAYEETPGVMRAAVDIINTPHQLQTARWSASSGVVTQRFTGALSEALAWGVSLSGQAAQVGGRWVVPVSSPLRVQGAETPGIQPTFFLLDMATGRVVLRALEGACGAPSNSTWRLPRVLASGASFLVPKRLHVEFQIASGTLVDNTSVGLVRLDASVLAPAQAQRIEESGCLHAGGAAPSFYDGGSWVEDGFHLRPQVVTAVAPAPFPLPSGTYILGTPPSSTPPALSAGTYSWTACYEWVDALGRVHRSAPAVPATLAVSQDSTAYLTVPVLGLTSKVGLRIVVYRTVANGTVFYRVGTSLQSFVQPTPQATDVQGFYDTQTDVSISSNEVLPYTGPTGGTSGGELWHHPPPAYAVSQLHQGYLFVLPLDEPNNVAYSLPLAPEESPAWADELRVRVPTTYGLAVGLATLDANLVVLCERGAWVIAGQGPSRDGRNNGLQEPAHVTGSVGCLSAVSVVSTEEGIFYQAPQGYFCLTRGLETVPAGEDVQRYARLTVGRALEVSARRELRWYTMAGTTLLYSQRWQQWAVWTGQPGQDAALLGDVVHYADGSRVRYEDPTSGLEAGAPLQLRAGTAWLKWGGFQGLERVWKALLLGSASGNFALTCEVFYDNKEDVPGQAYSTTVTGSTAQPWRLRLTLGKQLCNTLRFRWTVAAVSGRCDISLSALSLEFGVHPRFSKRGVQKFGTGG